VHGTAPGGTPYDANDPDLLLWVWATLVDTSLLVYTRYLGPLPLAEIERYYEEQQRFAVACGVPEGHWPESYGAFIEYVEETVTERLRVGDEAMAVARATLSPSLPLPLLALRPLVEGMNLATIGLLPPALRDEYGLRWGPGRERLLAASTVTLRRIMPLLPGLVRQFPPARAAQRRASAA
jgi:uncharacterized protein (DUF2236 family)